MTSFKVLVFCAAFSFFTLPSKAQSATRSTLPQDQSQDPFAARTEARYPVPPKRVPPPDPFAPVSTKLNAKDFGAACDGQTDDTGAIQNMYNTAAIDMRKEGGGGVIYFPPSTGVCKVSTLYVPSMGYNQGWLTSIFDNGLLVTGTIFPGTDTAYIGRTSNFMEMSGSFIWGETAEWQKPKGAVPGPVVDLDGVSQVYFSGIAFANAGGDYTGDGALDVVHMHDNNGAGSVTVTFDHCSFIGNFVVDSSAPNVNAGFGLHLIDSTITNELELSNTYMVTVHGGYLGKVLMQNVGALGYIGDLEIDDTLSEGLTNGDFLTVDTSGGMVGDITLHRVSIADPVGTTYMVKHINNSSINWNVNVEFDQIPVGSAGTGLIDPSSAPQLFSVTCFGANCDTILNQAKSTLYDFAGKWPKGPFTVYGSEYLPSPFVQVH